MALIDDLLQRLQKEKFEQQVARGGSGSYSLDYEDVTISITALHAGFQMQAQVGDLPQEGSEAFMELMLRGNLLGNSLEGSIVSLNDLGTKILLSVEHPKSLAYREFVDIVEDFLLLIDFWKQQLQTAAQ